MIKSTVAISALVVMLLILMVSVEPTATIATPTATYEATPTIKPTAKPTPTVKPTPKPTPKPARSGIQAGATLRGSLTYYCCCPRCCGSHVKQVKKGVYRSTTASGMRVQTGQAPPYPIASCNWLPLGSQVEAGGVVYTIEDRGGGGLSKRGNLDVYVYQGHKKALAMGRKSVTIRIVRVGR